MNVKTSRTLRRRYKGDGTLEVAFEQQKVSGISICSLCSREVQDVAVASLDHNKTVNEFVAEVEAGKSTETARRECNAQDNTRSTHPECNDSKNGHTTAEFLLKPSVPIKRYSEEELNEIRNTKGGRTAWKRLNFCKLLWKDADVPEFIGKLAKHPIFKVYSRTDESCSSAQNFKLHYLDMTGQAFKFSHPAAEGKESLEVHIQFNKDIMPPASTCNSPRRGLLIGIDFFWELVRLGFRVGEQPDVSLIRASIAQQFREQFDAGIKQLEQ